MNKKYFLLLYGVLTVGIAVALWGVNLWEAENIMYGLLIVPVQLGLMQLVFKHRDICGVLRESSSCCTICLIYAFNHQYYLCLFIYFLFNSTYHAYSYSLLREIHALCRCKLNHSEQASFS